MYQTTYHRPSSIDEAAALFAKGGDSKYLAGGHTLIPVMKVRLAAPSDVIDLGRIKELIGIEATVDALVIKAATTYYDITQSSVAKKAIPAIVHALKANWSAAALDDVTISADGLMGDIHGSSDYRANLIKVMAQRAVAEAG